LGTLLTLPSWRERAKLLGDRVAAAHVGCCVFLCCGYEQHFSYQQYLLYKQLISDWPKWKIFVHSQQKCIKQTCFKSLSFVDFEDMLTFWFGKVWVPVQAFK
jgi:hypothetical protein